MMREQVNELERENGRMREEKGELERQRDMLQVEDGRCEAVEQDLGHVLQLIHDGINSGTLRVSTGVIIILLTRREGREWDP